MDIGSALDILLRQAEECMNEGNKNTAVRLVGQALLLKDAAVVYRCVRVPEENIDENKQS